MSLKAELDAFRSDFMAQVPPEVREAMVRTDMQLAASGIAQRALKAGDRAPDFNLPDARGGYVRLKDLLATGPVVLSFYRGSWCPYCNLELHALQQALPEITRLSKESLDRALRIMAGLIGIIEDSGFSLAVETRDRKAETLAKIHSEEIRFGIVEKVDRIEIAAPPKGACLSGS
jgi:thiol-disulfide isomerase/thioredoxin